MAAVPASRPKPEHLLLKWAGTVLGKSEDEWTDVDAFKDGRLLLELLDRLWLGGSSGKQLERDANQGPEDQSRKPQSARDTASQNEGPGFECGVKKVTEPEPELTPCISPRTLAVKGKEAGVNLDVRTLEKVKEGDGAALHETLLSVYRPWIMQNGQKGVRRVSKGQISDTPEKGSGSKIVEDSSRASGRGSGSKKMEADQGGEIRAGAEETLAADLSGQSKLVAGMGEESGAEVVNRQQDSERPAEVLKGVRKVTSTIRSEEEKVAKVVTGAEALGGSAISAGLSPGAAYAAPAVAEPSQPGKKARANVLKRLNTKAKAGLVAGQMEKISSPVSAGDTFGGAGDKDQSAVSPSLVDGVETADLVQKEREGIDVTGFGEKWGVASGLEGRQESLQVREGENDGSSLLVQDKKVILSSSPKLESQSGSTKTRLAKLTGLGKAAVPGTAGGDGEGAKWQAPLPLRSAYSASDAQLTSARAWLADIIAGVSADVGDCEGPPYPPECESGAAHVRACELLLDTSSESELRQSGGDDAVSMTERRVAFVYEQLRVHGVRVSNLRRRKRSSGGAIDGEKLGAEAEIELTETLMSAAAELGMSVPRAVERIR